MIASVRPDPLEQLLERQHGIVSRPQARIHGVTRHQLRSQVRARRWRELGPRVVATTTGMLSFEQRCWAALLNGGAGAALSGSTAAQLDGLRGYEDERVHITVPRGATRPPALDGVVLHHSRRLGELDVSALREPRRTRMARSLVDLATWAADDDRACAVLAAAVQQGVVRPSEVRALLDRPGRQPRRGLLMLALDDIEGGAQSLAEIDFVKLCRGAGLPEPRRQALRCDADGRRRWLDVDWEEYGVSAEVDGAAHREARQWWRDMDRQNELTLAGSRLLRFPAMTIRLHPDRVVDQLRRALLQAGWPGSSGRARHL